MIGHALRLALSSLRAAPARTAAMVLGGMVALTLPALTWLGADVAETRLMDRAEHSPVLVGSRGDPFDLAMTALYFAGRVRDPVPSGVVEELSEYGLAVPLHVGHTASGTPIVGTGPEYYGARGLVVAEGRLPALLGEVVAGAGAAERFGLAPGATIRSDLENLYDLAGSYPLTLDVVGVLAPSHSPDDDAFFTGVETSWALEGLFHGHGEITSDQALNPCGGENLEATAALFMLDRVTDQNRASFHAHDDRVVLPVSAVLVFPPDQRRHDELLGDLALRADVAAVRPVEVVRSVLGVMVAVRDGLTAWFGAVALSTGVFLAALTSLSLRLRRDELRLMQRIGCSRFTVPLVVGAEIGLVAALSVLAAAGLTVGGLAVLAARLGG